MRPILFTLGNGWALHTYGVAVALGFAVGIFLAAKKARQLGWKSEDALDLAFWILVAGVLGSRLAYVLSHATDYVGLCRGTGAPRTVIQALTDCAAPLRIWEGGLVFYGGAVAATVATWRFVKRRNLRMGEAADLFAPALAIGHAFGRLGCFFAGCCYGSVSPQLGVAFPAVSLAFDELSAKGVLDPAALVTPPLHPTQLYEAGAELGIFLLLMVVWKRRLFSGQVALAYVVAYAPVRFAVELFRGDANRPYSQPASALLFVLAAVAMIVLYRRATRHRTASAEQAG